MDNNAYEGKVLHMTKRIKSKGNKQGIILVMVLLILAMAMIFISAALLLTNSTRGRLYGNTRQSQARLTVTSAAEAIYRAIEMQEISDDTLEALSSGAGKTVDLQVASGNVAGLGTATDNKTTVHFQEKSVGGDKYIYAKFTTVIGDASENVLMILKYNEPPKKNKLFSNQMDIAGNDGPTNLAQLNIGQSDASDTDGNTVVVRGSGNKFVIDRANQNIRSTHIFVGETAATAIDVWLRDSTYTGDMVFYGDYATLHWDLQPNIKGNVYFIGKNGGTDRGAFTVTEAASRTFGGNDIAWVFANRVANGDCTQVRDMLSARTQVFLLDGTASSLSWSASNVSGSVPSSGSAYDNWVANYTSGSKKAKVISDLKNYMGGTYTGSGAFPTATDAFKALGLSTTAPSGSKNYTMSGFLSDFAYSDSNQGTVPAGDYRIYDSAPNSWIKCNSNNRDNAGQVKYVFLDGSKTYNIYLGSDYDLSGVCFIVLNGGAGQVNFILENGADVRFGTDNCNWDGFTMGMVSVSSSGYSSPSAMYTAIANGTIKPSKTCYPLYKKGTMKPYINVYGAGNNKFEIGVAGGSVKNIVVEAYIGLFETKYPGKSQISISNQVQYFYGRIMAANFVASSDSNDNYLYYCPDPNAPEPDLPKPATTKYSVEDMIYYYDV